MSQPLGDQRRRPIGVIPSSEPPRVVDSAFAPERDARRPLQQTAPSAPNFLVGDPSDVGRHGKLDRRRQAKLYRLSLSGGAFGERIS